jgi:putative transposase
VRKEDEDWALFWCSLLEPVIFGEVPEEETPGFLKKIAQEERLFPNGIRRKPALTTLRRKLILYREGGFQAFARKPRSDRGTPRAHPLEVIQRAIELKRDQPLRSEETINQFLRTERGIILPRSTLFRYLKDAGATRLKLGVAKEPVRRRWTRDHSNALWVGDFEDGPYVLFQDHVVPTHLCAFIDCYSRDIVEARYYYRQNLDILIDSLLRGWATHGGSNELYVDNAKVYHARALKCACYALTILLHHRPVGDAPAGGLIERFFETVQGQFEAEVRAGDILTLDQLNRAFAAWLEMSYRRRPHDETGQPPGERYEQGLRAVRHVDMEAVLQYFLQREHRTVHKQFSDVQLDRRFYRVDQRFRGDRVDVRYDPFSSPETVLIYSLRDEYLGKGTLHHRDTPERPSSPPQGKPKYNYLDLLVAQHDEEIRARSQGIDFRKAVADASWPFPTFAKRLAQLLGRKGDLTSFTAAELETLQKLHARIPALTEPLLREAVESAPEKTLPCVLFQIQELSQRKES